MKHPEVKNLELRTKNLEPTTMKRLLILYISLLAIQTVFGNCPPKKQITVISYDASPRISYGTGKLIQALQSVGYRVTLQTIAAETRTPRLLAGSRIGIEFSHEGITIIAARFADALVKKEANIYQMHLDRSGKEGYYMMVYNSTVIISRVVAY